MVDALVALRAAGAKLAVCTNKLTHLSVALLDALDLTRYFDAVVGADSAPPPSPTPATCWPRSRPPAAIRPAP